MSILKEVFENLEVTKDAQESLILEAFFHLMDERDSEGKVGVLRSPQHKVQFLIINENDSDIDPIADAVSFMLAMKSDIDDIFKKDAH